MRVMVAAICCVMAAGSLGMESGIAQTQSKPAQNALIAKTQARPAQNAVLALDHGWQFRQVTSAPQEPEAGWLPATVPGDVHLDLLANKKIDDPFYRDNEAKLQWIENASWEYRDQF